MRDGGNFSTALADHCRSEPSRWCSTPSPTEWQLDAAQFLLEADVANCYFHDDPSVENVAERWCQHAETIGLKPAQAELHRDRAFRAIALVHGLLLEAGEDSKHEVLGENS